MPHKLSVIKHCHELTPDAELIGSVNFISIDNGKIIGRNYDGMGALEVIEGSIPVKGLHVVVMGAGGAGRAAIYEAKKRGAVVTLVNRTKDKGLRVAEEFGVLYANEVPDNFDILINATCIGMDPTDDRRLLDHDIKLDGVIILDMASRHGECLLQKIATKASAEYIAGSKMFNALTILGLDETCRRVSAAR